MRAEIISVGTELLLGDIVNTNSQYLAQNLADLGFSVYYQTVVGDNAARLRAVVNEAKARSDILVFTGGLGPTEDDLTKETVAEMFGDTLVPDGEELAKIEAHFAKRGGAMPRANAKQAMVPARGLKLDNPNGTAPGAWFRQGGKYAVLLPGPPREMRPMFENQVRPLLEAMQDSSIRSVTLRVFGIGESALEEQARELLEGENPTAALYAKTGEVHVRVTAKAPTARQADVMCGECAARFKALLGSAVYSDGGEDLETVVVRELLGSQKTLATAESCTGGLLSARITGVPGASGVFGYGAVTYANDAKHEKLGVRNGTLRRHGAVSSQVAAEMAFGAAKRGLADYGVGITGIAGPAGGTEEKPVGLVYVAVASGGEVYVKKPDMYNPARDYIRTHATNHALDMLRRRVQGLDIPGAKRFTKRQEADLERSGRPRLRGAGAWRAVVAVIAALAIVAMIVLGGYYGRQNSPSAPETAPPALPSAQGLRYGSAEYGVAACALVAQLAAENPATVGLVALPGGMAEQAVERHGAQAAQGENSRPALAAEAAPARAGHNAVIAGGEALSAIADYTAPEKMKELSTFTWFTESEIRVYRVFALFVTDAADAAGDFDPHIASFASYGDFLGFMLGAKVRSLCDIPLDMSMYDSFMTLTAADPQTEGRTLYLCGRLAHPAESTETIPAATAGKPLMPDAYYRARGESAPSEEELYSAWLRWYLSAGVTNSELQLRAGMPAADKSPVEAAAPAARALAVNTAAARVMLSSASVSGGGDGGDSSAEGQPPESGAQGGSSADGAPPPPSAPPVPAVVPPTPQRPDPATLTVTMNGLVTGGPTDEILAQICQSDAAGMGKEAVKALAVAAHSWILNRQGAGDAAPAVAGRPASPEVLGAVREAGRMILSGDGENPAFCPFYGMAAFGTNGPQTVFGGARPYLAGVGSPLDEGQSGWRHISTITADAMSAELREHFGADPDTMGGPETWLSDIEKNEGGYVQKLLVCGEEATGFELWRALSAGGTLHSPAFEVEFSGAEFVFISYGQGHGCGMSLAGARSYAAQGQSCEQILARYYPGAELILWD